jgi:hypothetical protein
MRHSTHLLAFCWLTTHAAGCGGGASGDGPDAEVEAPGLSWCDPAAWPSGAVPADGDDVVITDAMSIRLDCDTAAIGDLHVLGLLRVDDDTRVSLTADAVHVMSSGRFRIGYPDAPYAQQATITLTGARGEHTPRTVDAAFDNDGQQRALHVADGGEVSWYGAVPAVTRTRLADHAAAGATTLTVADAVTGWRAGDRIAISITDFHGTAQTEVHELAAVSDDGLVLTLATPLAAARWGRLQYPLDAPVDGSGVSLTQGAFNPPGADTPRVIDQRAHVVLLDRHIVVQGADDADWQEEGFGAHIMVMSLASTFRASGVLVERGGQRQAMGRYPFHWHMLSYSLADGTFLGNVDPADHFIENSVVLQSANRAYTIHGTSGTRVENNVAVDVLGHAYFLEDGTETDNTLARNVAMKVRPCIRNGLYCTMKVHDQEASGFWITNPANRVVENVASDATNGIWNSFATAIFGESALADARDPRDPSAEDFIPFSFALLEHRDNEAHGNAEAGIRTDRGVYDEAGNTDESAGWYRPDTEPEFTGNRSWKNRIAYRNRVHTPRYRGWLVADNEIGFTGATMGGTLRDTLAVGTSLNRATASPTAPTDDNRRAFASYHHSLDIIDITAINYAASAPAVLVTGQFVYGGGAFNGEDLYLFPVNLNMVRNGGWQLVNAHPGYLSPPTHFDDFPAVLQHNKQAFRRHFGESTTRDVHGYWGPAGNWMIPDAPFFTYGLAPSERVASPGSGRVSTSRMQVGLAAFFRGPVDIVDFRGAVRFERFLSTGTQVPNPDALLAPAPHPMTGRDLAMHDIPAGSTWINGGRFTTVGAGQHVKVSFPGDVQPQGELRVILANANALPPPSASPGPTDVVVLALPWPGAVAPVGYLGYDTVYSSFGSTGDAGPSPDPMTFRRLESTATSLADFMSASSNPDGAKLYFDDARDLAWVKVVGGLVPENFGYFDACLENADVSVECLQQGYALWLKTP